MVAKQLQEDPSDLRVAPLTPPLTGPLTGRKSSRSLGSSQLTIPRLKSSQLNDGLSVYKLLQVMSGVMSWDRLAS